MAYFENIHALVLQLSMLLAARKPQWEGQTAGVLGNNLGVPNTTDDGVYLNDAPRTLAVADLRHEIHRRRIEIEIDVTDLTGTYRVTVDGNNVDYDASVSTPADLATLRQEWIDAINADVTVGALVLAELDDDFESVKDNVIILTGLAEDDFSFAASITAGTAELFILADSSSGTARLYWTPKDNTSTISGWRLGLNGEYSITWRGMIERFDCAGLERMYVEVDDADGHVSDGGTGSGVTVWTYWHRAYAGYAVDERET